MRGLKEYASEYAEYSFYTPSPLEKAIGVCPLYAGRMRAKPHYEAGPKMVRNHVVQFVLSGQVIYAVNGERVLLNKGDMFCLFPDRTVQYGVVPDNPELRLVWIGLCGAGVGPLLEAVGLTEGRPFARKVFSPGFSGSLHHLFDEFRQLSAEGGCFRWLGKLYDIMEHLADSIRPKREGAYAKSSAAWIRDGETFMNTHYTENITVQDVANYVGIHRSHFSDAFSKQLGISPGQYLQQLRMRKGSQMLKETVLPVTEIALSLGYPDLYAFTRAFRNYFGMSPSHYRTHQTN